MAQGSAHCHSGAAKSALEAGGWGDSAGQESRGLRGSRSASVRANDSRGRGWWEESVRNERSWWGPQRRQALPAPQQLFAAACRVGKNRVCAATRQKQAGNAGMRKERSRERKQAANSRRLLSL